MVEVLEKKQPVVHPVVVLFNKNKEIFGSPFSLKILLANRYQICYNIPEIVRKRKINDYFTKPELGSY